MLRRGSFPLLLLISLGHVLVISAQVQSKSGIPLIEAAAFGVFARFQQTTTGVTDGVKSGWNRSTSRCVASSATTNNYVSG